MKIGASVHGGIYLGLYLENHIVVDTYDQEELMSWFEVDLRRLPTRGELELMFIDFDILRMEGGRYWSATEHTPYTAWYKDFRYDIRNWLYKSDRLNVRYIRRFKSLGIHYKNKDKRL